MREALAEFFKPGILFYWIPGNHVAEALFLVATSRIPEPEAGAEAVGVWYGSLGLETTVHETVHRWHEFIMDSFPRDDREQRRLRLVPRARGVHSQTGIAGLKQPAAVLLLSAASEQAGVGNDAPICSAPPPIDSRNTVRRDLRLMCPRDENPGAEWFSGGLVL